MAMSLQNLRDFVRSHADIDSTDLTDTVVDFFIKEAYAMICRRVAKWPMFQGSWTYNTVAATKDVLLATIGADCDSVVQIMAPQWLLVEISRDAGDKLYPTNYSTSGQPTIWARWGGAQSGASIRLYPTPDGVYTLNVRGYIKPDQTWLTVASGAGIPSQLPDDLHLAIGEWALYRAYLQQDDEYGAQYHKNAYDQFLAIVEEDLRSPRSQQPLVLGGGVHTTRYLPERLPFPFDF